MRPLPKVFLSIAAVALTFAAFLLPRTQEVRVRADGASSVYAGSDFRVDAGTRVPLPLLRPFDDLAVRGRVDSVVTAIVWPDVSALAARLGAEETLGAIGAELERVHSFVESQIPAVVPERARAAVLPETQTAGGGGLSREQLQALARCESGLDPYAGDPSPWRTGYFGLEAGHPVGGLSLAEQEAEVQRIYAQYGSRAWGCPI